MFTTKQFDDFAFKYNVYCLKFQQMVIASEVISTNVLNSSHLCCMHEFEWVLFSGLYKHIIIEKNTWLFQVDSSE